jgi:hypothetical protein
MDKLEIKQGSFIQQTQYFILDSRFSGNQCFSGPNWFLPDMSIRPACLGISVIFLNSNPLRFKETWISFIRACYPLANEVAKGYSNATVRPSVRPSHPCEHSRINILQWILTKLGTYLVLKRIWNPIDFQGQRSRSQGQIFTA